MKGKRDDARRRRHFRLCNALLFASSMLAALPLLVCVAAWGPGAEMPAWHIILRVLAPNPEVAVEAVILSGLMFAISVALWVSVNRRWKELRGTGR